jgi:hypothetical protein
MHAFGEQRIMYQRLLIHTVDAEDKLLRIASAVYLQQLYTRTSISKCSAALLRRHVP